MVRMCVAHAPEEKHIAQGEQDVHKKVNKYRSQLKAQDIQNFQAELGGACLKLEGNQQGPTVAHRELHSVFWNDLHGKRS